MNHYANSAVRARIAEFLGVGCQGSNPTAIGFATSGEPAQLPALPRSFAELSASLRHNQEIFRSLWDRESLLADLEIGYVNFDDPALSYTDYPRTFALQEPVRREIQRVLLGFGIAPLHLLSGRGHHFLWRIRRDSESFARLANLGRMAPSLRDRYDKRSSPGGERVDHTLGNAFVGLGRIMEYFAAEIKKRAAPILRLPIELSAFEVGPGERGREMISFDISQHADPLYARFTRVAYSRHLRTSEQLGPVTDETTSSPRPLFVIPLYEMSVEEAVTVMHDIEAVAALASYAPAKIPDCSHGTGNLLNSYLSSELAKFHCDFYAGEPEPPDRWLETYDRIDLDQLPPCVRFLLLNPNDVLLRPSSMRRVALTLLSLG